MVLHFLLNKNNKAKYLQIVDTDKAIVDKHFQNIY
jgi:hypothetical protein